MHSRSVNTHRPSSPLVVIVAIMISCFLNISDAQIMRSRGSVSSQAAQQSNARWPKPTQLLKEISVFEEYQITQQWASRTKELAQYLCTETAVTSEEAVQVLLALSEQAKAVDILIDRVAKTESTGQQEAKAIELISELQRFQYRLNRRIKIWAGVIDHSNAVVSRNVPPTRTISLSALPPNLDDLLQEQIPGNTGWQDYLAWDDLVNASRLVNKDDKARAVTRKAARKFLARYHSPALTDAQRELFQPFFAPEILDSIRDAATSDINYSKLMAAIEYLEGTSSGTLTNYLNSQYQNLLWSNDPIANQLAATIDSHWRNANFRVAINERLINQMLPQVPAMTEPVSERLQGAKISGQSLIQTDQLRIALIPNPNEISLGVETTGQVTSDTVARRSGFTFQNRGLADFKVFQKLAFSRTGVTSEEPLATSSARQRLIGLRGSFDRVPVVGWVTRRIAQQKAEEQTPEANQLTKNRIETGAKQRVEQEVNQMVTQFRRGIHEVVLSRLIAMDLEPETVQLSTSSNRIVGRYRIAGRDQMAAWQPRPTDFESDLLTVQLHQSAINNLIQRIGLNGQEFDPGSLAHHIREATGMAYLPENAAAEATFQFAKHDAVRVDFEDGIASVTFKFKKFQIGKGRPWRDISVETEFEPRYIGTRVVLDRGDSKVSAKRKKDLRVSDHVAIKGAFKVILERQYAFDLVPSAVRERIPDLTLGIDRLSLADGWCGVAFDNASDLKQSIPIVAPEEVEPGSWSDQLGSFQSEESRVDTPRTARRLGNQ